MVASRLKRALLTASFAVVGTTFAQTPAEPPAPLPPPDVAAAPVVAPDVTKARAVEFTSLRLLREKQIITEDEYAAAMKDLGEALGMRAADANTFTMGKWATTLYGFAEADFMYHSTQSFNDFVGNQVISKQGAYSGDNGRMTFTARDSRLGVRVKSPSPEGYSFTANLEGDFLGSEPGIYQNTGGTAPTAGTTNSEASFFANPTFRIRHAFFKAETPIVDFTVGQTWNLMGWQASFIPAVVQWPGVVGELYGRSVQARVSKTFKGDAASFDIAVAALRPSQRDSGVPNFEGGLKFSLNNWTGVHTGFLTSTDIRPFSIAVTGDIRTFKLPSLVANGAPNTVGGGGVAADIYIPIIPGTKNNKDNSLSVTAEFARGGGLADQYTGFASGISNPGLPPDAKGNPVAFPARVDPNMVAYDAAGVLHTVESASWFVNAEYYLPGVSGRVAVFGGYYSLALKNSSAFATAAGGVRTKASMIEAGAFVDATSSIRIGVDYANFANSWADGSFARDWAVQTSLFFFF